MQFSLEYNCFTMSCYFLLYNEGSSLPPPSSLSSRSSQSTESELPVLHSRFMLAIYFTHGSVYMSVLISQFILPSPSSSTGSHICSLYLWEPIYSFILFLGIYVSNAWISLYTHAHICLSLAEMLPVVLTVFF